MNESYVAPFWPKLVFGFIALFLILGFVYIAINDMYVKYSHRAKARNAKSAEASCQKAHNAKITWSKYSNITVFDAELLIFIPTNEREMSVINCITKRIPDHVSISNTKVACAQHPAKIGLQRRVSGQILAEPLEIITYTILKCADNKIPNNQDILLLQ